MYYLLCPEVAPPMTVSKGEKGEDYHRRMGRAKLASADFTKLERMRQKAQLARHAYAGHIWRQEDINMVLLDETLSPRNRTMFTFNNVKPIMEQWRGTAIQSNYTATIQPVTFRQATRRELNLEHQALMHTISETSLDMKRIIGKHYNLGDSMMDTLQRADSTFHDGLVDAMNHLNEAIMALNDFERYKGFDAMSFGFTGGLVEIARSYGPHFRWEKVAMEDFIYDTSFQMPDMSDASFKGVFPAMSMPKVASLFDVDRDALARIDNSIRMMGGFRDGFRGDVASRTKVRMATVMWTDLMYCEWGYVKGPGDVPTLVKVNYSENGDDPAYTYKDLIDPPDTQKIRDTFKGKKVRKSSVECTRFVSFVPWEYLVGCSADDHGKRTYKEGKINDLVLEYGMYDVQEYDAVDPTKIHDPIKVTTFASVDGEVISPIEAALDPNRFVNRVLSAMEGQMNMSGGKTPIVDMDLVDPSLKEDDVQVRIKQNRVIPMRANGRGINNAITTHDESPGSGAYNMLLVVNAVNEMINTVTGVHSPMVGKDQKDQVGKVTEILVQRGALMQEGFHDAIGDMELQKVKCNVTAGKEHYLQRPDILQDLVTDKDMLYLLLSEEMSLERFNATVARDNPERTRRQAANAWLDQLMAFKIIDAAFYAECYDQSTTQEVVRKLKAYTAKLQQAGMEQEKERRRQEIQAGLAAQQAQIAAEEKEVYKDQLETSNMIAKEGVKERANVTRDQLKYEAQARENDQDRAMELFANSQQQATPVA